MSDRPSLEQTLAELHLNRALKPYLRAKKFILVITLPWNSDLGEWKYVVADIVKDKISEDDDDWKNAMRASDSCTDMIVTEACASQGLEGVSLGRLRTVILVTHDMSEILLEHPSVAAADAVIKIEALSVAYMQRAFQIAVGRKIDEAEANDLITMPAKWRRIIVRAGRNPRAVVSAFKQSKVRSLAIIEDCEKPKEFKAQKLEDMHGYGEARAWGLELSQDIADYKSGFTQWSDVDSGLLLSGPPGCGKTTFAAALARTCGMNLVVGSYASWQSKGHQGDMLKAMRAAFAEARNKAPCILLIDEVDGFVTRGSSGGSDNGDYLRGIVNGLLEELDGSAGRDGVVVVGACNDPSIVDPALCRPGRLDRHIEIELPDDEARMAILKGHLNSDHDLDMRPFRTKTKGMSGADLEQLARSARRLARRERMTVEYRHVNACLPHRVRRSDDQMYRIAVHEIGHAVVGATANQVLNFVYIEPDYVPNSGGQVAGGAAFSVDNERPQDKQFFADRVCTSLAAMACEQLFFGSHGDGVIADLTEATATATYALTSVGMGDTLSSDGHRDHEVLARMRAFDPLLARRVEDMLQEQMVRAREILEANREVIDFLITELLKHNRLPGSIVYGALEVDQPAMNFG